MLHIVKTPEKLKLIHRYLQAEDTLLLVEKAVYAASEHSEYFAYINQLNDVYALQEDLQARGWLMKCANSIKIIDRFGFVELTANTSKSMSW